ncbi:V-set and immunoglobulin domain-containing protein 10-like 2 [Carcharodon carcharias]|uniref:V-set and immunoglobulin domain-containing protein 10-like 2 n=1 Tax=Carcharodon carcharias TaxID=13397 RepID=UPI001B7E47CC|nr:V-set and immunoglobulin domain-containing protein 10-like 2 [Carcharodon carcharias]
MPDVSTDLPNPELPLPDDVSNAAVPHCVDPVEEPQVVELGCSSRLDILDPEEVKYIESQVKGVIGQSVLLECGQSVPTIYIWGFTRPGFSDIRAVMYNYGMGPKLQKMASIFGDVKVLSDSASLVIDNLHLAAEGRFTCQSLYDTNDGAKLVYVFVDLHVLVPISKPSIQMSLSVPIEGSMISILCSVENGTGPLEYIWNRQATVSRSPVNVSESTDSLLNLTSVNRNHTGWYTCTAKNEVNEETSDRVWLDVIYGPDQPAINVTPYALNSVGYSAIEQDTISMTCSASSNPPSQYIWFHNNSQIYAGQQFVIERISRSQTGTYMCLAHNTFLNARTKTAIVLTVYYLPAGMPICTVLSVNDNRDIALWCSWEGGDPPATLQWVNTARDGIDVERKSSISAVKPGRETSNNSTYSCRASHPVLKADWSCRATALLPEGKPKCSATAVKSLEYTMLSCSWEGGLPQASLQWKNWRGNFLGKAERSISNQVLKSSPTYSGKEFICQATHPLTRSRACSIQLEAPDLLTSRNALTVFEGTDVHLTCILKAAYPSSEIVWHNNRNESVWLMPRKYLLHQETFWSNLTIRETDGDRDNGTYWCTASNVVGSSTLSIQLHVNKYPTPPNVTISKLLYGRQRTEVVLEWMTRGSGDLTGFMIQRRPARRSIRIRGRTKLEESITNPYTPWHIVASAIDPAIRGHKLGGMDPSVLYAFRILAVNHKTKGYPSEVKTPADPPFSALPAVIGAAVVGMLVAVVGTVLVFLYVMRNRENIPWLHDLLFQRPPSESREQINYPEDADVTSPTEGEDIQDGREQAEGTQ